MRTLKNLLLLGGLVTATSCDQLDDFIGGGDDDEPTMEMQPLTSSVVPNTVFDIKDPAVNVEILLTSKDILPSDSTFVYGSYTDGCALFDNGDDTYSFIVNLERDYSIARIKMNKDLQPYEGEYIVNSTATAFTAMCSGSGVSVEEHGFGPLYLSGGEWVGQGAGAQGVYVVDPYKSADLASFATRSAAMGEWATENAVVIGKNAYPGQTVAIIGDDDSANEYPESHLGMYVGAFGDLFAGDLYTLRGKNPVETEPGQGGLLFEMGMEEGTAYDAEWVPMSERTLTELNQEGIDSLSIGFQRIEDIDWRKGSADNERTLFFCVTGRYRSDNPDLAKRGTTFGRIYMVELNDDDPTGDCQITCILDGDKVGGIADGFHSPDNIVVTENYVYIQEDPNGYFDQNTAIQGWAKLYQYNISTGALSTVLECDEDNNPQYGGGGKWEITGMIDVTDIIDATEPTFMCGVQVHGWESDSSNPVSANNALRADGQAFFDPTAIAEGLSDLEGSFLFKITGLPR